MDLKKLAEEIVYGMEANMELDGSMKFYGDKWAWNRERIVSSIARGLERVQKETLETRIEWPSIKMGVIMEAIEENTKSKSNCQFFDGVKWALKHMRERTRLAPKEQVSE